jgi:hypothetical protein
MIHDLGILGRAKNQYQVVHLDELSNFAQVTIPGERFPWTLASLQGPLSHFLLSISPRLLEI